MKEAPFYVWLRLQLDRVVARWRGYCPYDWMDDHGACVICADVARRVLPVAQTSSRTRVARS